MVRGAAPAIADYPEFRQFQGFKNNVFQAFLAVIISSLSRKRTIPHARQDEMLISLIICSLPSPGLSGAGSTTVSNRPKLKIVRIHSTVRQPVSAYVRCCHSGGIPDEGKQLTHHIVFGLFGITSLALMIAHVAQTRKAYAKGIPSERLSLRRFDTANQSMTPELAKSITRANWLIAGNSIAFIATIAASHMIGFD